MKVKLNPSIGKLLVFPVAVISALALAACSSGAALPEPADTQTPEIRFILPGEHDSDIGLSGSGYFPVSVNVTGFKLVDKSGEPNVPGEGHIIFYKDVDVPTEPGKPAITAPGTYAETAEPFYYWPDIGVGEHTFSAELVNNDNTPLDFPVVVSTAVTAGIYWDG